jgi:hypothetical protein
MKGLNYLREKFPYLIQSDLKHEKDNLEDEILRFKTKF